MSEWTPTERRIRTPYGIVRYGGPCKDSYPSMQTLDQGGGHTILSLQGAAMRSFKAAQVRYAKRSGWSAKRLKANPDGRPILVLPGTNRTCETQRRLFASDSSRFARPEVTGHTRGLAIDVDQRQPNLQMVYSCLAAEGWTRTRPTDEPWHWSAPGVTI